MNELQNLMNEISEWSNKTFGNTQRNPAIVYHLAKEVDELLCELRINKNNQNNDKEVKMEFADCFMLLVDSASHFGMSANDLINYSIEKLEINKNRKWGKPDKNGVIEHIDLIEDTVKQNCNHRFSKCDGKERVCTNCGRPDLPR